MTPAVLRRYSVMQRQFVTNRAHCDGLARASVHQA